MPITTKFGKKVTYHEGLHLQSRMTIWSRSLERLRYKLNLHLHERNACRQQSR